MKRLGVVLSPMVTAAGILALSGVAMAQREGDAKGWMGGMSHEMVASANCPQIRVTKEKITEDEAQDLAQKYADKNLPGFQVVRPSDSWTDEDGIRLTGPIYGGGYNTLCYKIDDPSSGRYQAFYSVEYSIDAKNAAGVTRNLRVDQFGYVTEFAGPFGMAGATGPMGPTGPMGAQGPAGPMGPQATAADVKHWATFKNIMFDFDKSAIRSNETSRVADVATYMKQNPTARVGIDGHTDPRGTDPYNQDLSERRVDAIRDALVNAGVSAGRIHTGAFGETQPVCHDSTEACWQRDRRVEILIGTIETASR
jgi:outer membrane protein OmpA-like peptidoglycan-associated protein